MKTKNRRPRFQVSPEKLKTLIARTRKLHDQDLCVRKVEEQATALLSELRTLGPEFSDLVAPDDGCLACLDLSLGSALSRLEAIQS